MSGILTTIFAKAGYLFSYKTKLLYLNLVSSTTVDVHRSLYNIKQYFTKAKKVIEDRTLADIIARSSQRGGTTELVKKQEEAVDRDNLLQSALTIMQKIDTTKLLYFVYHNEPGTGLGPTLEFYNLLAAELKKVQFPIGAGGTMVSIWRDDVVNLQLFPRAMPCVDRDTLIEVCRLF